MIAVKDVTAEEFRRPLLCDGSPDCRGRVTHWLPAGDIVCRDGRKWCDVLLCDRHAKAHPGARLQAPSYVYNGRVRPLERELLFRFRPSLRRRLREVAHLPMTGLARKVGATVYIVSGWESDELVRPVADRNYDAFVAYLGWLHETAELHPEAVASETPAPPSFDDLGFDAFLDDLGFDTPSNALLKPWGLG